MVHVNKWGPSIRDGIRLSMAWQAFAACYGARRPGGEALEEWFFPEGVQVKEGTWLVAQEQYCAHCPVRAQCEEWGRVHHYAGMWGGILFNTSGKIVPAFKYWQENGELKKNGSRNQKPSKAETAVIETEVA